MQNSLSCFLVNKNEQKEITGCLQSVPSDDLPSGDVTIRVVYSSINYKDALAATGHPGVVRNFPHIPGIDAAGYVVESKSDRFQVGDAVIVTSYELGVERWGAGLNSFASNQNGWSPCLRD